MQILKVGKATVLAAHDMIDLVRKTSGVFVNEAVFATMSSTAGYLSAGLLADVTGHARGSGELSPSPFSGCVQAP